MAEFYLEKGDAASALEHFQGLIKRNAHDPSAAKKIAECYLQLGRWKEADDWIEQSSAARRPRCLTWTRGEKRHSHNRLELLTTRRDDDGQGSLHGMLGRTEGSHGPHPKVVRAYDRGKKTAKTAGRPPCQPAASYVLPGPTKQSQTLRDLGLLAIDLKDESHQYSH